LNALGISKFDGLKISDEMTKPRIFNPQLQSFLASVGKDVLAYARYSRTDGTVGLAPKERASCETDSRGYSGAGALLVTPFSVPTGTYPAFWCPGFFAGAAWMPLFIRRGYVDRLVLA
jgi:hypothetical protein